MSDLWKDPDWMPYYEDLVRTARSVLPGLTYDEFLNKVLEHTVLEGIALGERPKETEAQLEFVRGRLLEAWERSERLKVEN